MSDIALDTTGFCKGIDTDHYVGVIDTDKVLASGIEFLIAKASQSNHFVDPEFARTWESCGETGLTRGSYHFYVAGVDPIAQADHYLATIDSVGGLKPYDLPPAVDIEDLSLRGYTGTDTKLIADLHAYIHTVKVATGRSNMILYTGASFIGEHLDASFVSMYLWVARYNALPPASVAPWPFWDLWQKAAGESGGHIVPGVPVSCDINLFRGDHDDMIARFGLAT